MTQSFEYSDAEVAALYNQLNGWSPAEDFYLDFALAAESVLDVGCGTGSFLHAVRDRGHKGRLSGIDPDLSALTMARLRSGIEWITGRADEMTWLGEFDLAVMMSHAFQFLVTDDEIHRSLVAIRQALKPGKTFMFETRSARRRSWETWAAAEPEVIIDPSGRLIMMTYEIDSVANGVVTFSESTRTPDGTLLRSDRAAMRFLTIDELDNHLKSANFTIEARYGDWDRSPHFENSKEIIVSARAPG